MEIIVLALPVVALLAAMLRRPPGGARPRNHPEHCVCGGSGEILILEAPPLQDLHPCDQEWPDAP